MSDLPAVEIDYDLFCEASLELHKIATKAEQMMLMLQGGDWMLLQQLITFELVAGRAARKFDLISLPTIPPSSIHLMHMLKERYAMAKPPSDDDVRAARDEATKVWGLWERFYETVPSISDLDSLIDETNEMVSSIMDEIYEQDETTELARKRMAGIIT